MMTGPHIVTSPPLSRAKSFIYIQYLRGFAAAIVVYFHTKVYLWSFHWDLDRSFGYSGVDIFFAISGFIMTVTTFKRSPTIHYFIAKRVLRIYPIYWIATALGLSIILLFPNVVMKQGVDLTYIVSSLLLIPVQNESATSNGVPILKIAWTLVFEIFFYAIFATSLLFVNRLMRLFFISFLIFCLVGAGVIFKPTSATLLFYTNPMIIEFLFGCFVGYLICLEKAVPLWVVWGLLLVSIALLFVGSGNGDGFARVLYFGVPAACIVFCCAALESAQTVVHQIGLLRLLGDASYSIYLFQTFFISGVRIAADRFHLPVETPLVGSLGVVGSVVLALVGGVMIHLWIERPCLSWARHLARSIRPRRTMEGELLSANRIGTGT